MFTSQISSAKVVTGSETYFDKSVVCLQVQERLLGPLGSAFSGSNTGNSSSERSFEAGLKLIAARELLEQSSAVFNIRSPHLVDAPIGAGGTHVEIWLPVGPDQDFLDANVQETSSD